MEKELIELFESVKKAADAAENAPGEEKRCLDALGRLKEFPVNYQVLVSTQVGKRLRQLTKHRSNKIKSLASDVVEIWKNIIVQETMKNKNNGTVANGDSVKAEPVKVEQKSAVKSVKVDRTAHSGSPKSEKTVKLEKSSSVKVEVSQTSKNERVHIEKKVKVESSSEERVQVERNVRVETSGSEGRRPGPDPVGPPKLTSLVLCGDAPRDKIRGMFAEALCKVSSEVDDDLQDRVNQCDPYRVAVLVETAMFQKLGNMNGAHKQKYRSIVFNLKDSKNPDFRRKVLLGDFEPKAISDLTPEQMASDAMKVKNAELAQKALFNSERAAAPKASTNEFTCGRCKKKECTYYQMQTRSADEPMTTFVTCVNCNNHWKFC